MTAVRLSGSRCVVTGGVGFIGSTLVIELLQKGASVKVIDNLVTGRKSNLNQVLNQVGFAEIDIRNLDAVRKEIRGSEFIFHLAAINSVPRSIEHPDLAISSNVMGTLNLLMAAKECGIRKLVNASSSSVYGGIKEEMKKESMAAWPLSPYAISKYSAELLVKNYFEVYGLETVSLRYFNVFGPRQDPNSPYAAVIPKFLSALLKKESPIVFGDGTQARDFTFVNNVVEATLLALVNGKPGEVYNVGGGSLTTLNELLEHLTVTTGSRIKPKYEDWRKGDVYRSGADVSKTKAELGFESKISLKEGLQNMTEWYVREEQHNP